ncbi:hypothetical protein [Streptomyces sp. CBMA156]|uniref:hypothetical protein n=1 Tax=Streptomyces sp. CBMA156 TaxID=1930280 RepID=UPI001661B0DA|nr:hypothetical protein [Streptomyces sp. CBMA156]MBD0673988.1 hypothetical protein [Streptomyces sp. CBMA156]
MSASTPTVPARRPHQRIVNTEITTLDVGSAEGVREAIGLFARRTLKDAAIGHDRDERTHAATIQALNVLLDMLNTCCPACRGRGTLDDDACPNTAAHRPSSRPSGGARRRGSSASSTG